MRNRAVLAVCLLTVMVTACGSSEEPPEVVEPLMQKHFLPTTERFLDALALSLPELPRDELEFRFQMVMASLATTATINATQPNHPNTDSENMDDAKTIGRLVTFLAAGLRAPSAVAS